MFKGFGVKAYIVVSIVCISLLFPTIVSSAVVYGKATCGGKNIKGGFKLYYADGSTTYIEVKDGNYRVKLKRGIYKVEYDDKPTRKIRSTSQSRMQNIDFCN